MNAGPSQKILLPLMATVALVHGAVPRGEQTMASASADAGYIGLAYSIAAEQDLSPLAAGGVCVEKENGASDCSMRARWNDWC